MTNRVLRIALQAAGVLGPVLAFTQPVLAKPQARSCLLRYQSGFTTTCTDPSVVVDSNGVWCTQHCAYLATQRAGRATPTGERRRADRARDGGERQRPAGRSAQGASHWRCALEVAGS